MPGSKVVRISKDAPASWEEALRQHLYFKQAKGLREAAWYGRAKDGTREVHEK